MKKVMLFMSGVSADVESDLNQLGTLGLLHVTPFQPAKDESIDGTISKLSDLEKAIKVLEAYAESTPVESAGKGDLAFLNAENAKGLLLEKVLELDAQREALVKDIKQQVLALDWYARWGNVLASDVALIQSKGINLKMYDVDASELKNLADRDDVHVVGQEGKVAQIILMSEDAEAELSYKEAEMPSISSADAEALRSENMKQLAASEQMLITLYSHTALLEEAIVDGEELLHKYNVQHSALSIEDSVRCYKGYVPVDKAQELLTAAEANQWGYVFADPTDDELEGVPTLVTTPRWAQRIKPVMDFMGLESGYTEHDSSKVFMLFFTFFTGVLVGDAGYGFIFFLLTLLAHKKSGFKRKIEFELIYTLSASVMFWGVITGTYFGAEAIAEIPFLSNLVIDKLASFGGDSLFLQKLMFIVGAVHMSIGHLQTAWKYNNSLKALSEIGWISIIWGLFFVVLDMVLGYSAPSYMMWLLYGGGLLVTLFSNTKGNFFKGMLTSIGSLPLSIINGFSDIISYIRLYAVGLATVLMASSFNDLAIGDGITTVLSGIMAVLILLLGHGLNMALAAMSVIVHGVRLNMLEYGGHAGIEFSGDEYNPFKLNNKK